MVVPQLFHEVADGLWNTNLFIITAGEAVSFLNMPILSLLNILSPFMMPSGVERPLSSRIRVDARWP